MRSGLLNRIAKERGNRPNSSRLFLRYLLSYVVVLMIPLLILGGLIYYSFFHILENELNKNNRNQLLQLQYTFDSKLVEMNKIAYQIYSDPKLTAYQMEIGKPLNVQEGIAELKKYMVGNNLPYDVFVYYSELDRLYSSASSYSVPEFLQYFKYAGWGRDIFLREMKTLHRNTTRPAENVSVYGADMRIVTYIVPNPNSSRDNPITVFFMIDEKAVHKMLAYGNGDMILVNEASDMIASSPRADAGHAETLNSLLKRQAAAGASSIKLDRGEMNAWFVKSPNTGWGYWMLLPVNEAMQQLIYTKSLFIISLIFILLVAAGAIAFTMRLNYHPLRQLKRFAENKLGKLLLHVNEIEALRFAIDYIAKSKDEWVQNRSLAIKEHIMSKLLQGRYMSIQEFNEEGREIGLAFTLPFFRVALFLLKYEESGGKPDYGQLVTLIESRLPPELEAYGTASIEDGRLVLIVAAADEGEAALRAYLMKLRESLNAEFGVQATIGVGGGRQEAGEIGKSYIEASTAVDYRLIKGRNQVIFFRDIGARTGLHTHYPVRQFEALELAALEGNADEMGRILDDLYALVQQSELPLFEIRCLCFDIINTVNKAMCQINKSQLNDNRSGHPDVISLVGFETVDELWTAMRTFSADIGLAIRDRRAEESADLNERIESYIRSRYDDQQFLIQTMADQFGISPSNLNYYFKQRHDYTISEYVNHLRLEKAKRLLLTTDCSLSEIVQQIGYSDVSSFVRKFKNAIGTTPGSFRKIKA